MAGKPKKKASRVVFIVEMIVLVVLVAFIFFYSQIIKGIDSIGTEASGTSEETGSETMTVSGVKVDPTADADADAAEENEGVSENQTLKGYTNIALVGIDTRDQDQINYGNSDTMIIASINNETGKVRMVSVYRDTLLNIGTRESSASQGDADEELVDLDPSETGGSSGDAGAADEPTAAPSENTAETPAENTAEEPTTDINTGDGGTSANNSSSENGDSGNGSSSENGSSGSGSSENENTASSSSPDKKSTGSASSNSENSSGKSSKSSKSSSEKSGSGEETVPISSDTNSEAESTKTESEESTASHSEYSKKTNKYYNYSEKSSSEKQTTGTVTAEGRYDKANAAYAQGSAKQLLTMLNKNLDLNIHEYVVVNFTAVAKMIEDLGGMDIEMTPQEVKIMNDYCKPTSRYTGMSYNEITPSEETETYHLNGVQALSYARIRYTAGNDFKRTQRQRIVIEKMVEKAKAKGLDAVNAVISDVFPECLTSFSRTEIISMAAQFFNYEIEETAGFPFEHIEKNTTVRSKTLDCVVPVTLADNVKELHEFLFDEEDYQPTATVLEYSNDIASLSGLTEESEDVARKNSVIADAGGEADRVK